MFFPIFLWWKRKLAALNTWAIVLVQHFEQEEKLDNSYRNIFWCFPELIKRNKIEFHLPPTPAGVNYLSF